MQSQNQGHYHRYSWVVLSSVLLAYFSLMFQRNDISTVLPSLIAAYHWTPETAGWVNSAWVWSYSVMQIPFGYVSERWLGTRATVTLGTAMMALGAVLFGFWMPSVVLGIVCRLTIGAGAAAILVPSNSMFARWFSSKRRGLQSAVLQTGGSLAVVCASVVMPALVAGSIILVGLPTVQSAYLVVGVPMVAVVPAVFYFTRNRPEDIGLPPIDEGERETLKTNSGDEEMSVGATLRSSRQPYALTLVYVGFLGGAGIMSWVTVYFVDVYHLGAPTAALLLALVSVVPWLFGVPLSGVLGDRIGHGRLMILSLLASLVVISVLAVLVAFYGPMPLPYTVALLFLFTCCTSGYVNAWPLTTDFFTPRVAGTVAGMMNTGGNVASALVAVVPGYFIVEESPRSFVSVFGLAALLLVVALLSSTLLPRRGRRLAPKQDL